MALTDLQAKFVDEYLVDLNATAAAGRAGYSDPNIGRRLVTKSNVAEAIAIAIEKRSKRVQRTADDVMRDLAAIRADAMQVVHDKDGNAVMLDKPSAIKTLELEGKHLMMWTDKQKVSFDPDAPLGIRLNVSFE